MQSQGFGLVLGLNGLAVLALGPFSGVLLDLCRDAIVRTLAA